MEHALNIVPHKVLTQKSFKILWLLKIFSDFVFIIILSTLRENKIAAEYVFQFTQN